MRRGAYDEPRGDERQRRHRAGPVPAARPDPDLRPGAGRDRGDQPGPQVDRATGDPGTGGGRRAPRRALRRERVRPHPRRPAVRPPRRTPLDPPGVDPTAWLEAELGALVAAVEQAAREGMPDLAWHLAGSLVDFFELRGHLTDWQRTHTAALQATTMAGDTVGTAVILQGLAFLEMARDHYEPALAHLDRAAELFGSADVLVGEVNCAAGAAVCHRLVGRLDQAAACAHQADALAEEDGYLLGQAHARYELGVVLREQ